MAAGKSRRNESGQATVELALTLPVVVLLALIVAQAGLVAKDMLLLSHAAREGARAAAVDPTLDAARAGAVGGAALDASRLTVSISGGRDEGDRLVATVTYSSPTNVPLIGQLIGDIDLESSVAMRVE